VNDYRRHAKGHTHTHTHTHTPATIPLYTIVSGLLLFPSPTPDRHPLLPLAWSRPCILYNLDVRPEEKNIRLFRKYNHLYEQYVKNQSGNLAMLLLQTEDELNALKSKVEETVNVYKDVIRRFFFFLKKKFAFAHIAVHRIDSR